MVGSLDLLALLVTMSEEITAEENEQLVELMGEEFLEEFRRIAQRR